DVVPEVVEDVDLAATRWPREPILGLHHLVELVLDAVPDLLADGLAGDVLERARAQVRDRALGERQVLPATQAHTIAEPPVRRLVRVGLLVAHRVLRDVPVRVMLHAAERAGTPVRRERADIGAEEVGTELLLVPLEDAGEVRGALRGRRRLAGQ